MNVERTIEFLLQQQARTEAHEARTDELFRQVLARQDKTDRRLDGMTKAVRMGFKMLVKLTEMHRQTSRRVDRIENRVDRIDTRVDRIDTRVDRIDRNVGRLVQAFLRGGGNGRNGPNGGNRRNSR